MGYSSVLAFSRSQGTATVWLGYIMVAMMLLWLGLRQWLNGNLEKFEATCLDLLGRPLFLCPIQMLAKFYV